MAVDVDRFHTISKDITPDYLLQKGHDDEVEVVTSCRRLSRGMTEIFGSGSDLPDAPEDPKLVEFFRYNMEHKNRGIFVILNHQNFHMKNASDREGTCVDKENLEETAKLLGFEVFAHDDLTLSDLEKVINNYAKLDYSDSDCFACAVLSHGESGDVIYAKDGKYQVQSLMTPFRDCRTLVGKPKIFFIQACRGTELDHGRKGGDQPDALSFFEEEKVDLTIPMEADFLIGFSTVEGYFAWRNEESGSYFIQALCLCLKRYHDTMELMQIMTRVNRMVAYQFESDVDAPLYTKKKQMPSIVTRLTGDVYFRTSRDMTDGFRSSVLRAIPCTIKEKPNKVLLEKQLLKTKLELTKLLKKKAELQVKQHTLQEKIYEMELHTKDS